MAVTATRTISVGFTGDVQAQPSLAAAVNYASPGSIQSVTLASGNNTIVVPTGALGVTIQKPSGNTVQLALKFVSGDTGFPLGLTDPDSVSLLPNMNTFVIGAGAGVTVRLIWS